MRPHTPFTVMITSLLPCIIFAVIGIAVVAKGGANVPYGWGLVALSAVGIVLGVFQLRSVLKRGSVKRIPLLYLYASSLVSVILGVVLSFSSLPGGTTIINARGYPVTAHPSNPTFAIIGAVFIGIAIVMMAVSMFATVRRGYPLHYRTLGELKEFIMLVIHRRSR